MSFTGTRVGPEQGCPHTFVHTVKDIQVQMTGNKVRTETHRLTHQARTENHKVSPSALCDDLGGGGLGSSLGSKPKLICQFENQKMKKRKMFHFWTKLKSSVCVNADRQQEVNTAADIITDACDIITDITDALQKMEEKVTSPSSLRS